MLNKHIFRCLLAVFLITAVAVNAQEKKADSYRKLKSSASRKSSEQLLKDADKLKSKDPAGALDKVEEAVGVSIVEEDTRSEGKAYVLLGEINEGIGEWELAIQNYNKAYQKLAGQFRDTPEYVTTLKGLGHAYLQAGQFEAALQYINDALALLPDGSDLQESLLLDLSEVYYQTARFNEALKALDRVRARGGKVAGGDVRLQNQKAKIYARMNNTEKTKDFYQNSINTLRSNETDPEGEASLQKTKEEIASVFRAQSRYDDEISLRNQSIEYNLGNKNMAEVTRDKVEIGKTLEAKGNSRAALKELEEAADIADTIDDPAAQANAFLSLAGSYEKNGKPNQALGAFRKYSEAVSRKDSQGVRALADRSALIRRQQDIEELTQDVSIGQREDTIEKATLSRQRLVIYGLLALILVIGVTSYFIYRNAQASKVANQLLALKSLRSQMNPHFIFNALNSVNNFVSQQDERAANKFLSDFSQLMRLVLENSQEDFISLQKEQEILALYLKLEHYRFRDKFDYEILVGDDLHLENIEIPPMLIQPYIENSVWHGLRYKEARGKLTLRFQKSSADLLVEITDDGIGRKQSAALKTENQKKHHSMGLKNIQERLKLINRVYKVNYRVFVEDVEGGGTRVRIFLPLTKPLLAA